MATYSSFAELHYAQWASEARQRSSVKLAEGSIELPATSEGQESHPCDDILREYLKMDRHDRKALVVFLAWIFQARKRSQRALPPKRSQSDLFASLTRRLEAARSRLDKTVERVADWDNTLLRGKVVTTITSLIRRLEARIWDFSAEGRCYLVLSSVLENI
jgi:hypothetical protein